MFKGIVHVYKKRSSARWIYILKKWKPSFCKSTCWFVEGSTSLDDEPLIFRASGDCCRFDTYFMYDLRYGLDEWESLPHHFKDHTWSSYLTWANLTGAWVDVKLCFLSHFITLSKIRTKLPLEWTEASRSWVKLCVFSKKICIFIVVVYAKRSDEVGTT
jgi:hypothetical protein